MNQGELKKENYRNKVEPAKTLALSIFIDFLNKEGITEIEAPAMYVLDHEYHIKKGRELKEEFDKRWTEEKKNKYPEIYKREKKNLSSFYENQDTISEIKTERFIQGLLRLVSHYPNGKIKSYPGEVDNFLHLSIPPIVNKNDISGEILKDMYDLVDAKYED